MTVRRVDVRMNTSNLNIPGQAVNGPHSFNLPQHTTRGSPPLPGTSQDNEPDDTDSEDLYDLLETEEGWRDRYPFLETHGYTLRTRYRPDWIKSWLVTNRQAYRCEDSVISRYDVILDATHRQSGDRVCIKIIDRDSQEAHIAQSLSSEERLRNPLNHCVPILDVLPDPIDPSQSLLVMPYLRPFNDPAFGAIGEVLDFVRQTLEGLCYIHSQNVAHRDCAAANIMMDGRPLYPRGHHPVRLGRSLDIGSDVHPLSRIDHPVKYYFIDFGLSSLFKDNEPPYVLGTKGRDKAPELSKEKPYNAFMVDIWMIGRIYEKEFLEKYFDLDFLQPLVSAMVAPQPERRLTAEAALQMFQNIRGRISNSELRWRLRGRDESPPVRVMFDTIDVAKQGLHQLNRFLR